jgi:4-amino-4-deoxy-L-arabinose transferase-like glycosyltransferase
MLVIESDLSLKNRLSVLNIVFIILIVAIATFMILFRLGSNSFYAWDEAIYAQIAREMVSSGDWLTPHWNFTPFFEKPPLMMWITASFYSIFKINEFWARAASAFSGILLVLVTYLVGKKEFNMRVGVLAAIALLSNPEFLLFSRIGMTDMMLSLFIYLSVLTYLYTRKDKRCWYGIGIFFALAFMTKFWAAGVIPLLLLIALAWDARFKETFSSKHFWGAIFLSIILIIPWHLSMLMMHSKPFIDRYLIYNLVNRSTSGLEGNLGTSMYYYDHLKVMFSPWFSLIPFAMANSLNDLINKDRGTKPALLLILILIVFGLYSVVIQTKLPGYIIPVYPGIYILISSMIMRAFDSHKSFAFSALIYSLFIALLLATGLLGTSLIATRKEIILVTIILAVISIIIFSISYIFGKTKYKTYFDTFLLKLKAFFSTTSLENTDPQFIKENPGKLLFIKSSVVIITILFIGSLMTRSVHLYAFNPSPIAELSKIAGKTSPTEPLLASYELQTILFYSNRPIIDYDGIEKLPSIIKNKGGQEIILSDQELESLSAEYEFRVIAEISPYAYATINKRSRP